MMNADEYLTRFGGHFDYPASPPKSPEQILDEAIEYIHQHGWCRGQAQDAEGRVCLEGSFAVPQRRLGGANAYRAWKALWAVVGYNPIAWNDTQCKDADDAIHALKMAKEQL